VDQRGDGQCPTALQCGQDGERRDRKKQVPHQRPRALQDQPSQEREDRELGGLLTCVDHGHEAGESVFVGDIFRIDRHRQVILQTKQARHQKYTGADRAGERKGAKHNQCRTCRLDQPAFFVIDMITRRSLQSPVGAHELNQAQAEQSGVQQQEVVGRQIGAERRREKATQYPADTEGHREKRRMQLELARGEIFRNGKPEEGVEDDFEEIGGSADRLRRTG
jgi:hypothetical protein